MSKQRDLDSKTPLMSERFEYLWQDNENYKKPTKMDAPSYVEHLMAWVQSNVDNEQMFPSRIGKISPISHFHNDNPDWS
jgi:hypothetical protein